MILLLVLEYVYIGFLLVGTNFGLLFELNTNAICFMKPDSNKRRNSHVSLRWNIVYHWNDIT